MTDINWDRACPNPAALVILPWLDESGNQNGATITKRAADGQLYGCRDVGYGFHYHDCLAAWIKDAEGQSLAVENHTS